MILLISLMCSCAATSSLDQTVETGDNASVSQDATQATASSNAKAEAIENVITENTDGIPVHYFVIAALVFGMIIPQPRFIRWLF